MQTEIKKWGNSAVIRLPAAMLAQLNLKVGAPVSLEIKEGQLVIEPTANVKYKLDNLLAGITAKNKHEEADWGEAVGLERTA